MRMPQTRAAAILACLAAGWVLLAALLPVAARAETPPFDGSILLWSDSDDLAFDVWPLGGAGQTLTRRVTLQVTSAQPYELSVRLKGDRFVIPVDPAWSAVGSPSPIPAARLSYSLAADSGWSALSSAPAVIGSARPSEGPETHVYRLVFRIDDGGDLGWDILAGAYLNDVTFELRPAEEPLPAPSSAPSAGPVPSATSTTLPADATPAAPEAIATPTQSPSPDVGVPDPDPDSAVPAWSTTGPATFTGPFPEPASSIPAARPTVGLEIADPAGFIAPHDEPLFLLDGVGQTAEWTHQAADPVRIRVSFTPPADLAPGIHWVHVGITNRLGERSTCSWPFAVTAPEASGWPTLAMPARAVFETPTIEVTASVSGTLTPDPEPGLGHLLSLGPVILAPAAPDSPIPPAELPEYTLRLWADGVPVGVLLPSDGAGGYVCLWDTRSATLGEQRISVIATRPTSSDERLSQKSYESVIWERWVIIERRVEP